MPHVGHICAISRHFDRISFFFKMDTMMATGVLLFCISVWDRYLNFRSVQNLSMFILLSLYNKVDVLTLC